MIGIKVKEKVGGGRKKGGREGARRGGKIVLKKSIIFNE